MAKKRQNPRVPREVEFKLVAPTLEELRQVGDYVLSNPHYVTAADKRHRPAIIEDFAMLGAPREVTPIRARVYFDDLRLHGYRNDIEIRVERDEKSGFYKQTIKFGNNKADRNAKFDRDELHADIRTPHPDLTKLPREYQKLLCEIFKKDKIKDIKLLPLQTLYSQRMRFDYAPDGNKGQLIEYAQDAFRGVTCTGYTYDRYEAELEMKKGSTDILEKEARRLRTNFNFLQSGRSSKPTPGFEKLMAQLDDPENRKYLHDRLSANEFKIIKAARFAP